MEYDRGVSFFFSIFNQMELYLVQNQNENCPHDLILLNFEGKWKFIFLSVCWEKFPAATETETHTYWYSGNPIQGPP